MFLARDAGFEVSARAKMGSRRCGWLGSVADVVLMDLVMPVMDGVRPSKSSDVKVPGVEIVALTACSKMSSWSWRSEPELSVYSAQDARAPSSKKLFAPPQPGRVHLSSQAARLAARAARTRSGEPLTSVETDVLRLVSLGLATRRSPASWGSAKAPSRHTSAACSQARSAKSHPGCLARSAHGPGQLE